MRRPAQILDLLTKNPAGLLTAELAVLLQLTKPIEMKRLGTTLSEMKRAGEIRIIERRRVNRGKPVNLWGLGASSAETANRSGNTDTASLSHQDKRTPVRPPPPLPVDPPRAATPHHATLAVCPWCAQDISEARALELLRSGQLVLTQPDAAPADEPAEEVSSDDAD